MGALLVALLVEAVGVVRRASLESRLGDPATTSRSGCTPRANTGLVWPAGALLVALPVETAGAARRAQRERRLGGLCDFHHLLLGV